MNKFSKSNEKTINTKIKQFILICSLIPTFMFSGCTASSKPSVPSFFLNSGVHKWTSETFKEFYFISFYKNLFLYDFDQNNCFGHISVYEKIILPNTVTKFTYRDGETIEIDIGFEFSYLQDSLDYEKITIVDNTRNAKYLFTTNRDEKVILEDMDMTYLEYSLQGTYTQNGKEERISFGFGFNEIYGFQCAIGPENSILSFDRDNSFYINSPIKENNAYGNFIVFQNCVTLFFEHNSLFEYLDKELILTWVY